MEKLINILKEINPDIDYNLEKNLIDDGIFGSIEIMTIIVEIEEQFGVVIDAEDVTPENFNAVENIMKLIEK